jgi:hypothetical protein
MIVEPFAGDSVADNLNPVGRVFYGASSHLRAGITREAWSGSGGAGR